MNKKRLIAFIVIHLIIFFFTVGYTIEMCGLGSIFIPLIKGSVDIDGSDFSAIFNMFIIFTNGILGFITAGLYIIITVIFSCLFILPFSFLSLRKETFVSAEEVKLTGKIFTLSWAAEYIVCAVITGGKSLIFNMLISIVPFFLEYIYLRKIRRMSGNTVNEPGKRS